MYFTLKDQYMRKYPYKQPPTPILMGFGAVSSACGQIVAYPLQVSYP
jgi:hypothetical protein